MLGILKEQQVEEVLEKSVTGRIGCTDGKIVYILPVTYLYDGKYIIAHSKEGLKIRIMREHTDVCFEVDEIQTQASWKSVLVWGKYEEPKDQREKYYALDRLIRKIHKLKVSETA
ncbi:MAG TPA: pyridoxamine 5'-phosphate oxidase family protein, partial [Chitinophagaceae bacterium]